MRERDIYLAAVEIDDLNARAAYLEQVCNGNHPLRAAVEALLNSRAKDEGFLDKPLVQRELFETALVPQQATPGPSLSDQPTVEMFETGTVIDGRFTLLEVLGQGGMGTVFAARQSTPIQRVVALKLIRAGLDSQSVLARFNAERQALALMDHPNIARVYEGGATRAGRPYFVMELVRGAPINEYCEQKRFDVRARLETFLSVCDAVQHAHQKGIIHRDLKPGNVLVTDIDGRPAVKIIDFGVAKATEQRLTEESIGDWGTVVGTPSYMSPEQADSTSVDIDTRTDVYALGAVLYELLAGSPPFGKPDASSGSLLEMLRKVREVEPLRPSERLQSSSNLPAIAAGRQIEPARLVRLLQTDLDWIVLKALEKDRDRRYSTASGFAADIQRYLDDQPVVARPPTRRYRLQKAVRRNKLAIGAGAAVVAALVVGTTASVWQAVRAENEARRAILALEELQATAPAFAEQARLLVLEGKLADAQDKLAYASKLRPDIAEYHVARGDLLQSELRLADATAAYRTALTLNPGDRRAQSSAALCDELLAAPRRDDGKLDDVGLRRLYHFMQQQQRPVAELIPVARLLDEERQQVLSYWIGRLKSIPIYSLSEISERVSIRDDGQLALDLNKSSIRNLGAACDLPLGSLDLTGCEQIVDFTPLSRFRSLTSLRLAGTRIADLSPLRGLPLESLVLSETRFTLNYAGTVTKRLTPIELGTRVTSLAPLAGMPLTEFRADPIATADFSALAGAPLQICVIRAPQLTDLTFLRNSPVRELSLAGCEQARGYQLLSELPGLESLILPQNLHTLSNEECAAIEGLRGCGGLKRLAFQAGPAAPHFPELTADEFWQAWPSLAWMRRLHAEGLERVLLRQLPDRTWELRVDTSSLRDLTILQGAPLSYLNLGYTPVDDLTPLRGMPLQILELHSTQVVDLSPLAGMQLKSLNLSNTRVNDISVVRGMPLRAIRLEGCRQLTDLSPLEETYTLQEATLPPHPQNLEFLRKFPRMRRLAFRQDSRFTPETTFLEFWQQWDAQQKASAATATESPVRPER